MPKAAATFEGEPCPKGHTTRYVAKRNCVECSKAQFARWKAENLEEAKAARRRIHADNPGPGRLRQRTFRERHPERVRTRLATWRAENRDHVLAYASDYRKANPDWCRQHNTIRRGRKMGAAGHFTVAQANAILAAQNGRCSYCNVSDDLHLDHATPLIRGGSNWPWNLQWLCPQHNLGKYTKTDAEYRREIGLPPSLWISLQLWSAALCLAPEILVPDVVL